ncbi:MAG TPA: hypothetical protein VMV69_20525 [Pirellulales bacterium]|nr:hypothetical protein [Pirellulales bacterium]
MAGYQLDECMDYKRLALACQRQGLTTVYRFPRSLKTRIGTKDPEVVERLLPKGRALLTSDRTFADDNAGVIDEGHPGIVIVANFAKKPLRSKDVERTLATFKGRFPDWPNIDPSNSVIEISEIGVQVSRVLDHKVEICALLTLDMPDWIERFRRALTFNINLGNPSSPSID